MTTSPAVGRGYCRVGLRSADLLLKQPSRLPYEGRDGFAEGCRSRTGDFTR